MSKLSNTIMMLRLLQNGKKYTIKELAQQIEVSPRMIREYKQELEYAGIFIDSLRGPYGGYYLNQNIKLPELTKKHQIIPLDNKEYYNLFSKAITNRNKCYIEYYSKEHDKISKRVIRPYNLMILENEWGVAAYCENKQEIRHFYLNRIIEIKELEEKF